MERIDNESTVKTTVEEKSDREGGGALRRALGVMEGGKDKALRGQRKAKMGEKGAKEHR